MPPVNQWLLGSQDNKICPKLVTRKSIASHGRSLINIALSLSRKTKNYFKTFILKVLTVINTWGMFREKLTIYSSYFFLVKNFPSQLNNKNHKGHQFKIKITNKSNKAHIWQLLLYSNSLNLGLTKESIFLWNSFNTILRNISNNWKAI